MSEMNRDEAERCIEIALSARSSGDLAKAERFLSKSISMFSTNQATTLLSQVQTEIRIQSTNQSADGRTSTSTYQSTTTQSTSKASSTASISQPTKHEPQYTPEQRAAAQKVVKQSNYYEILGLSLPSSTNEISETEIKSAYRKMALKFHPDKNHAPEAEEAFKKVSAAFQCLSDPQKRRIYDQSGYSEPQAGGGGHRGFNGFSGFHHGHPQRESDFSPEDIFNMFFGMNPQFNQMQGRRVFTQRMPRRAPQQQQQHNNQQQQEQGFSLMSFIHLLPLLLLFVFSFLSAPSGTDSPFSLQQTRQYSYQHVTPTHNLPFWVDSAMYTKINRDSHISKQIYSAVEQEYLKRWRAGCEQENKEREKLSKDVMYSKSRNGEGSAKHLQAVQRLSKYQSVNCDKVNEFFSKPKR